MKIRTSLHRVLAAVLLLVFSITVTPLPAQAESSSREIPTSAVSTSGGDRVDLYDLSSLQADRTEGSMVVAAQHAGDKAAAEPSVQEKHDCNRCGGFWEIHFGGYRWAWWALAGAGLIAIHAN